MIKDGYRPSQNGSMASAAMAFMRDHGVLKDIYSESTGVAHKTAKGTKVSVRTVKAPGFDPKGVLRCVLPFACACFRQRLREQGHATSARCC